MTTKKSLFYDSNFVESQLIQDTQSPDNCPSCSKSDDLTDAETMDRFVVF